MQTIYFGNTLINDVFVGNVRMDDIVSYPLNLSSEAYMFLSSSATLSNITIASAVNTLVNDMKSYGIWDKMYCVYPMVGGNSDSCKWNLKDTTKYQLNYTGSWTFNSDGMTCSGTQFANTNFTGFGEITAFSSSFSLGIYSRTSTATGGVDLGDSSNNVYLAVRYSDATTKFVVGANNQSTANSDGKGFYIGTRNFPTESNRTYKNGTLVNFAGASTAASTVTNYFIGGYPADPGQKNYAFAFIGAGLSPTNVTDFNTAMTTFQTALGRNV